MTSALAIENNKWEDIKCPIKGCLNWITNERDVGDYGICKDCMHIIYNIGILGGFRKDVLHTDLIIKLYNHKLTSWR